MAKRGKRRCTERRSLVASCWRAFLLQLKRDLLLIFIVLGVIVGFVVGATVNGPVGRVVDPEDKATILLLIGFPGELFMNMLKMLILPLIVASLVCALSTLDKKAAGKVGRRTVVYYLTTTLLAVVLGILLVMTIRPGDSGQGAKEDIPREPYRNLDSFLDLIRSCFPNNIVEATFSQKKTKYTPVAARVDSFNRTVDHGAGPPNNTLKIFSNGTHNLTTLTRTIHGASDTVPSGTTVVPNGGMNVLGLVVFSIVFGLVLGRLGPRGEPLKAFFEALNAVIIKMVGLVMWYSPVGICSLIAVKLAAMDNILQVFRVLGMFMITVISGLLVHALVVLPLIYIVLTRNNPYAFIRGMRKAIITAFGTDSSSATLPTTMRCVEEQNKVDRRISRFVLPLGATVNMDGTALYEGVSALWIAQLNGIELGPGQIITTVLTATAAAIGAAGIPSAGVVTMIMVLTAVNLPTKEIGLILAVDWFLDRFRTCVNVLGDALGAGIVEHLSRNDLDTPYCVTTGARETSDHEEEVEKLTCV